MVCAALLWPSDPGEEEMDPEPESMDVMDAAEPAEEEGG